MRPQLESSNREVLAGLVERVTYHNSENGFCVLRAKVRGHRDVVTVVGHAAAIAAGEWITASGDWVNDRTHGQQFKALGCFNRRAVRDVAVVEEARAQMHRKVQGQFPAVTLTFNLQPGTDLHIWQGGIPTRRPYEFRGRRARSHSTFPLRSPIEKRHHLRDFAGQNKFGIHHFRQ
jgi:hypothetical protein